MLSIDTKKKEILGNFFHPGRALTDGRVIVQDHDFVSSQQRLVPYGVFDTRRNEGFLLSSRGSDTCRLACDAIWRWWQRLGKRHYQYAPRLLLLCDCGGSNGNRQHLFKEELCYLAADLQCDIQVAHYPPGCSKYNPIEHRLFCHVSRSLQAVVLKTIEIAASIYLPHHDHLGPAHRDRNCPTQLGKEHPSKSRFLDDNPIVFDDFVPELNYSAPVGRHAMMRIGEVILRSFLS